MRSEAPPDEGFAQSDAMMLHVEQVPAVMPGPRADEFIIVSAIFLVLFISGFAYYIITAAPEASRVTSLTPVLRSAGTKRTAVKGAQPRRFTERSKARNSTIFNHGRAQSPVLICGLMSPGRLPSGANDSVWVSWRQLPDVSACDYILLDIPANEDGSYDESQYRFLLEAKVKSRFLFTLASGRPFRDIQAQIRQLPFKNSAAVMRRSPGVCGFGLLDDARGTRGRAVTDEAIRSTVKLFSELTSSLIEGGYEKRNIANFLALRPVGLRAHFVRFSKLLRTLDGLVGFLIILSISAPRAICVVEATSAWDSPECFVKDDVQPTVEESLQLIATVDWPRSRFALTLSLRIDVFAKVDYTHRGLDESGPMHSAAGKSCYSHTHHFVRRGECPVAEAPSSAAHPADTYGECNFVATAWQGEWRVQSFETAASMERTMLRAYRSLGPSKHGILSWLLYNVTSYVAVRYCRLGHTRIDKVREVLNRYRQPKPTS